MLFLRPVPLPRRSPTPRPSCEGWREKAARGREWRGPRGVRGRSAALAAPGGPGSPARSYVGGSQQHILWSGGCVGGENAGFALSGPMAAWAGGRGTPAAALGPSVQQRRAARGRAGGAGVRTPGPGAAAVPRLLWAGPGPGPGSGPGSRWARGGAPRPAAAGRGHTPSEPGGDAGGRRGPGRGTGGARGCGRCPESLPAPSPEPSAPASEFFCVETPTKAKGCKLLFRFYFSGTFLEVLEAEPKAL